MPDFHYKAVDPGGKPVSGRLQAAGPDEALAELAARGLSAQASDLAEVAAEGAARAGRLSSQEAVEVGSQVAELAAAGLPLSSGLRALAEEVGRRGLRRVLVSLADQIESGTSPEAAFAAQGARLPDHLGGLITAGLHSGQLAKVLHEFVALERTRAELRRRVWLSLAYPILLVSLMLALAIVLPESIVPNFMAIYEDFGLPLPVATQIALIVLLFGRWFCLGMAVLVGGTMLVLRFLPGAVLLRSFLYQVPLLGPLWRYSTLVELAGMVRLLLLQQVPLPEALRLTAGGLHDGYLAAGCRRLAERVEAGESLPECVAAMPHFPASLVPIVDWGQRNSALADAFAAAAEMFEGRVQSRTGGLEVIIPAVMFLAVAGFAGICVIALLMPMLSLINYLS